MTFSRTRCAHCRQKFESKRPGQIVHEECAADYVIAQREKEERKAEKQARMAARVERAETRRRKGALKTRNEVLAEAKVAIQAFRRLEELVKGRGCISCKRSREEVESGPWRPGGYWDGGHFKSKGAYPELALEPLNIWLQCKSCNAGSGKYARKGYTVAANFEANLAEIEGQELVDWLNGPHDQKHYDMDQLIAIRNEYRAKTNRLKKERA
ncbi:hypothetical protein HNP33_003724 [Comamonas odontotermitis]|uniref:Uncharacterized protein n=1 Tax=Comamonas odontotermitis TaxID=379895 RepID=A0ABR6RKA7_9BURK|nr:recombination protein NinG [Comamonas odontotermitis]MBB6579610.1 hypothetical protein [Comamonas odontotermitis]